VRNDRNGLGKTCNSVRQQTFGDYEWLIIDGASTDGTAEYALSMRAPNTVAASQPDAGIFDAMNKGLDRASGTFVVFLNAGDIFVHERTLEEVAALLSGRGDIDLLYGDSLEKFDGAQPIYKSARGHESVNYGMFCCHQSIFYRRSVLADMHYDTSFRIAGDYEFTARFLAKTKRIHRFAAAICEFDLSGASRQLEHVGRAENWKIQRDVLGLSLVQRIFFQSAYLLSAFSRRHLPIVYKTLRFAMPND
jgi:putative colanic acid biosynthesis glycosyltransferase